MQLAQTKEKLEQLRLGGFIEVLAEVIMNTSQQLSLQEALGLMADRELLIRDNRRQSRLLKQAKLRYPDACVEDIDYGQSREFNRDQLRMLTHGEWISQRRNVLLIGPTGVGKSYIACALGHQACRLGLSVRYYRLSRLLEKLYIGHADGSYQRQLDQLSRIDLLVLDDWGIDQLNRQARRDLLEVCEDRSERRSTVITTQLPMEEWHQYIGDPTVADAICDRLINQAYVIKITGESMRKAKKILTHVDQSVVS